ncbi:MAG: VWA domain-containing protein [Bacteroidetes bacterium]|nr:VWA domain-containing protein [Bacteroidota bacterium]MBU1720099.1 VWA domain-containing protein [Bacteroidota bacterium]
MQFASRWYFWMFLIFIPLIVWYIWGRKIHNPDLKISTTQPFAAVMPSARVWLRHSTFILRLLALTAFIIALARPQSTRSGQDITIEGIDIVMAMDISGSMLAEDFKPNRLESAKQVASEFIDGRPEDRIGLVIFSGESFTQCPLTTDHAFIKNLFPEIKSGMIDDGTSIGMGLSNAVNRLRNSEAKSKVIILLTDGVNNMGSIAPLTAAEIAKLFGIRVYTIGVGKEGTAPYPFQTPFGVRYDQIEVKIDEALLKEISDLTGGQYFRATSENSLREIYREIDMMEKSKINITEFRKPTEEFLPFAILGLLILLLDLALRFTVFKSLP